MVREGYIERIKYHSDETGYSILSVSTNDGEETFVGNVSGVSEGMYIQAEGEYVHHQIYGIQFSFTGCELSLPEDIDGVIRFLSSGMIKGIGEVLAKRIVKKFGEDTLRIIDEEPERLAEVKGISERIAINIGVSCKPISPRMAAVVLCFARSSSRRPMRMNATIIVADSKYRWASSPREVHTFGNRRLNTLKR